MACGLRVPDPRKLPHFASWPRLSPGEPAQQTSQVVRRGGDLVPFADIHQAPQPRPPRPTRFADVGEAAFAHLAPPPLQGLPLVPLHPPPVAGYGPLKRLRLIDPLR